VPALLNASHIVPWNVDVKNRTNPRNGLCLNCLHDRAFDSGLLTVTPEGTVKLSTKIKVKTNSGDQALQQFVLRFEGAKISPPTHFAPEASFLQYHNEHVFVK
jgi:putative restriction endonuclease